MNRWTIDNWAGAVAAADHLQGEPSGKDMMVKVAHGLAQQWWSEHGVDTRTLAWRDQAECIGSMDCLRAACPLGNIRAVEKLAGIRRGRLEYWVTLPFWEILRQARGTLNLTDSIMSAVADLSRVENSRLHEFTNMGVRHVQLPELWSFGDGDAWEAKTMSPRLDQIVGSVRLSMLRPSESLYEDQRFILQGVSEVQPRSAGMSWAARVFALHEAFPKRGRLNMMSNLIGWREGAFYIGPTRRAPEWDASVLRRLIGRRLAAQSEWSAALHIGGALAGVTIPTTPHGALALFRTRTSFVGERRKRALLHWVRGHVRRRSGADQEVRRHLRGVREFSWNGIDVQLSPAQADA